MLRYHETSDSIMQNKTAFVFIRGDYPGLIVFNHGYNVIDYPRRVYLDSSSTKKENHNRIIGPTKEENNDRIKQFLELKSGWNGHGAEAIDREVISKCIILLEFLKIIIVQILIRLLHKLCHQKL